LQGFPEYQTLLIPTWALSRSLCSMPVAYSMACDAPWALGFVMLRETLLRSLASSGMAPGRWRREVVESALLDKMSAVFLLVLLPMPCQSGKTYIWLHWVLAHQFGRMAPAMLLLLSILLGLYDGMYRVNNAMAMAVSKSWQKKLWLCSSTYLLCICVGLSGN
jgi:hypothetical protein